MNRDKSNQTRSLQEVGQIRQGHFNVKNQTFTQISTKIEIKPINFILISMMA